MDATAVDTTVLTVLGSAFGVMFATIITLMITSIRFQHRDSIEIRGEIERSNSTLRGEIERSSSKNRKLIERFNKELRSEIERNHDKVVTSLDDVRDRLARVEGHLGIGVHPPTEPEPSDDNIDDSSEAA